MGLIHEKIIAVMADSDAISKDRRNQQQGFNFRGIDDVYNALHPLLAKHGVFSATKVLSERAEERQTKSGGNLIYRILKLLKRHLLLILLLKHLLNLIHLEELLTLNLL